MRKSSKITLGFLTLTMVFLLLSAPATSVPTYNSSIRTDALQQDFVIELANVVAGIGDSVYSSVVSYGADDGGRYPVTGGASVLDQDGLSQALVWLVIYTQQEGFDAYLNRAPSDNPEGLAFIAIYPATLSPTQALIKAATGAGVFESLYGVTFNLMYAEAAVGGISYFAFSSVPNDTVFSAVAADTAAIQSGGFGDLMDADRVTSAPVGWAGYGAATWDIDGDYRLSMQGMGWVTDGAFTETTVGGEQVYTLSTTNIFGTGQVTPQSDVSFALSRLKFTFPYPIKPTSISPTTSNPYPQVSGQMIWDLLHPAPGLSLDPTSLGNDYSVSFTVDMDRTFPNVQNQLVIDQTNLNDNGILEAEFNLSNTGGARADNIALSFPLGPAFNKIVDKNIEIYSIKPSLTLNESIIAPAINLSVSIPGVIDTNYDAFSLQGWFTYTANGSLALWDEATTEIEMFNKNVLGQQFRVALTSVDPDASPFDIGGFPEALITAIDTFITQPLNDLDLGFSTASDIQNILSNNLADTWNATTQTILNSMFDLSPTFTVLENDFTLVQKEVVTGLATTELQWFMEMVHPGLNPGESDVVSFSIADIPIASQKLPLLDLTKGTDSTTGYPTGALVAKEQNYQEVMQYIFQGFGYDGRPLSFNPDDGFVQFLNSFDSNVYWSPGMTFSYEDPNGFPFFGVSNGQNLQIADDEAVLGATVTTDVQSYEIGQTKTITIDVLNSGDIAAEDVVVHLFQTRLGRDNSLVEDLLYIDSFTVGTLPAGGSAEVVTTDDSLAFLGYSGYFAVIESVSDAGQGPEIIPDFLNLGITQFDAGGETKNWVMSTMSGVLTLPQGFDQTPSFPEPRVVVDLALSPDPATTELFVGNTITFTYTLTNEGDASTTATFVQSYDATKVSVESLTSSKGSATNAVAGDAGTIVVANIELDDNTGDNVATITIQYKILATDAVIPAAIVQFTIDAESSLGDTADMGTDVTLGGGGSTLLGLSAGAAAQQQSKTDANQDSNSAAFSASSSVGASVNTVQNTESTQQAGSGFIGISLGESLGLMLVPLGLLAMRRRR